MRGRKVEDCVGPEITLTLSSRTIRDIHTALGYWPAFAARFLEGVNGPPFTCRLCAGHWLLVTYLAGSSAEYHGRTDWLVTTNAVLQAVIATARWDAKEVANLMTPPRAG